MKNVFRVFCCVVMVMGFSRCLSLIAPDIAMTVATESAKFLFERYYKMRITPRSFDTRSGDDAKTDFAKQPRGFGIELKVEKLTQNGWEATDEKKQVFRADDRVRFKLRTNGSAYVGIFGNGTVIWPPPNGRGLIPDSEFLSHANQEIVMGPFGFVPPAGKESHVVLISPVPFSEQAVNLFPGQIRTGKVSLGFIESMEKESNSPGKTREMVIEAANNITYAASTDTDPLKPIRYEFRLEYR